MNYPPLSFECVYFFIWRVIFIHPQCSQDSKTQESISENCLVVDAIFFHYFSAYVITEMYYFCAIV